MRHAVRQLKTQSDNKNQMDFLELKEQFENKLKGDFKFELLDLHYSPYAFGSGMTVYRIKGRIIKVMYDGRDNEIELITSKPHDKYPNTSWTTIFTGLPSDFIENGVAKLNDLYGQGS